MTDRLTKKQINIEELSRNTGAKWHSHVQHCVIIVKISNEEGSWEVIGDPTCSASATFGWKTLGPNDEFKKENTRLHEFLL